MGNGTDDQSVSTSSDHTPRGVHLLWEELSYSVKLLDNSAKTILHRLRGQAKPGELVAVMGPSGSGKTSLLQALRGAVPNVDGHITVNGDPLPDKWGSVAGYVPQHTHLFPTLTCREVLRFALRFKLPPRTTERELNMKLQQIADKLQLNNCLDTMIGDTTRRGLSGGELRRLSVAMEITSDPRILFLDEPTTGLDASGALRLVKLLRNMSSGGDTILCTIHQPRSNIFSLFDQVILLAAGRLVYAGPPAHPMLSHFSRLGYECPTSENPADFILDLVNTKEDSESSGGRKSDERERIIEELEEAFRESDAYDQLVHVDGSCRDLPPINVEEWEDMSLPWVRQFWEIAKRAWVFKLKEPQAVLTQLANSIVLPLFLGSIFWQIPANQEGIYERFGALSFAVLCQAFMAVDCVLLFPLERQVYLRESEQGMYSTSSFFWGRTLAETPFHILITSIFATLIYLMLGLQQDTEKFFVFMLVIEVATLTGTSMLTAVGAISKNVDIANGVCVFVLMLFALFNGFYVHNDNIPVYFRWISTISFLGTAVQPAAVSEFKGLEFDCGDEPVGCITTGEEAIVSLSLEDQIMEDIGILCLQIVIYRFISYLGLKYLYTGQPVSCWRSRQ